MGMGIERICNALEQEGSLLPSSGARSLAIMTALGRHN